MLNSKNAAISLASLALIALVAGPVRADDYMLPVAYNVEENGQTISDAAAACKAQHDAAEFIRELAKSDGDFHPDVAEVNCRPEILASGVEQD